MNMTPRQLEALQFIQGYAKTNGYCPSFEEIKDALGLASKSGVHRIVEALESRGLIRRLKHQARSLELRGDWYVPPPPPVKIAPAKGREDQLHKAVADYLRRVHPGLLWYHPANGGARSAREGAKLKAMGVRPGTPDLAFILPGGQAAFIELKTGTGRLHSAQEAFGRQAIAAQAWWALCRSLDEVIATLDEWGVKGRAVRAAA